VVADLYHAFMILDCGSLNVIYDRYSRKPDIDLQFYKRVGSYVVNKELVKSFKISNLEIEIKKA
jgi:predicted phage gp36 major capsid-like protein